MWSISFDHNAEITSRILPGLLALFTALASGAAGAFIMSREEISDSIGGVAIAISLVPPLCVVGIALNQGQWGAAGGALMLFTTNFLVISLAGGVTFVLTGLGRVAITDELQRMRRNAFLVIVVATLLITIPLSLTTYQSVKHALENRTAVEEVDKWLTGTTQQLVDVDVRDQLVQVTIEGYGNLPSLRTLANQLAGRFKRPITLDLRLVPTQVETSGAVAP